MDLHQFSIAVLLLVSLLTSNLLCVSSHGGDDDKDEDDDDHFSMNTHTKLLVISLDGFRHDFLDLFEPPTMLKIASEGVRASSLTSSYITKTFPNHYTIATGLYEESHGIVANDMYDPFWKEEFRSCSNSSCKKWYGGHPIWNTNELNNNHEKPKETNTSNPVLTRVRRHGGGHEDVVETQYASGAIYWPGSNVSANDINITFSIDYVDADEKTYLNFTQRIDVIISWFTHPETPINLGMLYYEYPDKVCHKYGPESAEVKEKVLEIDEGLKYLLEELAEHGLSDTNLIILSDHGFADVEGFVFLDDCITNGTYNVTENSPVYMIWPINDSEELKTELYNNLSNCEGMTPHLKGSNELKDYHYSDNRRISPIVVMTDIPDGDQPAKMMIQYRDPSIKWNPKGNHGWNNTWEKMHALFIANGPAFKKGRIHRPFVNVNIYPLMCKVLGITCPASNGSLSVVSDMLIESNEAVTMWTVVAVSLIVALVAGIMIVGAGKLSCSSTSFNTGNTSNIRSYSVHMNGSKGFERATLLETSDEEF